MNNEVDFEKLIKRFGEAVCSGDSQAVSACFAPDGVYHDILYGSFHGRAGIENMIANYFYRDAKDFVWTFEEVVSDGKVGYARYHFAFTATSPGSEGLQIAFPGFCCCRLENGLIKEYSEMADRATGLIKLGYSDERIIKILRRWAN
jgi:ketosteroid isomerase-like protein